MVAGFDKGYGLTDAKYLQFMIFEANRGIIGLQYLISRHFHTATLQYLKQMLNFGLN